MAYDSLPEVLLVHPSPDKWVPGDNPSSVLFINGIVAHWFANVESREMSEIAYGIANCMDVEAVEVTLPADWLSKIPREHRGEVAFEEDDHGPDAFNTAWNTDDVWWYIHNVWLPSAEAAKAEREAYGRTEHE